MSDIPDDETSFTKITTTPPIPIKQAREARHAPLSQALGEFLKGLDLPPLPEELPLASTYLPFPNAHLRLFLYLREISNFTVAYGIIQDTDANSPKKYHSQVPPHKSHNKEFISPLLSEEDKSTTADTIRTTIVSLKAQHETYINQETKARSSQAKRFFEGLPKLIHPHSYLASKGIYKLNQGPLLSLDLRQDSEGSLVLPVSLPNPDFFSFQKIKLDHTRKFKAGTPTKGGFLAIGNKKNPDQIYLTEGFATGYTSHCIALEALPDQSILTFVCFSANNLPHVSEYVSKTYPNARITIHADDDYSRTPNTGWRYAVASAKENPNIRVLMPNFPRTVIRTEKDTDINDAWRLSNYDMTDHIENLKLSHMSETIYRSEGGNGTFWKTKEEVIPPTALNISTALRKLGVTPAYNEFSKLYFATAPSHIGNRWKGFDRIAEMTWAELPRFSLSVNLAKLKERLPILANRVSIHPRREFFLSLPAKWDKVLRAEDHLIRLGGAPDTPLTRIVTKRFLIGQYGRAVIPGFKNDIAPVIFSNTQGYSKSRYCEALAFREEWFASGDILDQKISNVMAITAGIGIIEVAEAMGLKGSSNERTKANVTRTKDRDRMAYDRFATEDYREWSMIITTNDRKPLTDLTGNRRFPILEVTKNIDVKTFIEEREQIMAEIGVLFMNGERAWFDDKEYAMLTAHQSDWLAPNHFDEVKEYLEDTLPEDGDRFSISDLNIAMDTIPHLKNRKNVSLVLAMTQLGFHKRKGEFGKLNKVWGFARVARHQTGKVYVTLKEGEKVTWIDARNQEGYVLKDVI